MIHFPLNIFSRCLHELFYGKQFFHKTKHFFVENYLNSKIKNLQFYVFTSKIPLIVLKSLYLKKYIYIPPVSLVITNAILIN